MNTSKGFQLNESATWMKLAFWTGKTAKPEEPFVADDGRPDDTSRNISNRRIYFGDDLCFHC
jgi:hypothetical protein